jgi:hypothetical protein
MSNAEPTNRYVGMAKMFPDSLSPRRFPTVIRRIARTPIATRSGNRAGTADVICSTADEVETATVMM